MHEKARESYIIGNSYHRHRQLSHSLFSLLIQSSSQIANTMNNHEGDPPNNLCATKEMCKYCFDIVIIELFKSHRHQISRRNLIASNPISTTTVTKCPLFVTWDKVKTTSNSPEYHLRGCIGTLAPQKLHIALGQYAKTSAFNDPRFRPISMSDVPHLRVSVSLLVNYEDCCDCLDWEIGKHGIIINFEHNGKDYSGELSNYYICYLECRLFYELWNNMVTLS